MGQRAGLRSPEDIQKLGWVDEALAELDLVVGSVHSYMNLEAAAMTERLLRALENRYLSILGHPSGRVLLRRDGFAFDFERVAEAAAERGVCLEINASPERLDLDAVLVRAAKAKGARFVISTDAHHPGALADMNRRLRQLRISQKTRLGPIR